MTVENPDTSVATGDPGVEVVGPADFETLTTTPACKRERVLETNDVLLVRTEIDGDGTSDWHEHGEREAYGVVLEGRTRIEYGPDGSEAVEAAAGEFFHVPAGVVHRNVNPGNADLVLAVGVVGSSNPWITVGGPATIPAGEEPRVAGEDDLVPTSKLKNLTREMPFPDARVQQVRGHAEAEITSEWHHHGDNDVFGFMVNGIGFAEWGTGEHDRKVTNAGEFFRIPAGVVHRDVNPSDEKQDYYLWLTGTEPRNVPVDGPNAGTR